jgi:signal peptidase I
MSVEVHTQTRELMAPNASGSAGFYRPNWRSHRALLPLLQFVVLLVLAYASYLLTSRFFVGSVQVVGKSMIPALHEGEHLLLNRWIFYLHAPRAGDIVVLRDPLDDALAVKRIIGVPGDRIVLGDGTIQVNGRRLKEPYLPRATLTFPYMGHRTQSFLCGENQYLLLGDNRNDSADSRTYGLVVREKILGRIVH